jgi:hypothetical protein
VSADRAAPPHRSPPERAGAETGVDLFTAHGRPLPPSDDVTPAAPGTAADRAPRPPGVADTGGHVVEPRVSPAHRAVPPVGGVRPGAAVVIAVGLGLTALAIGLVQAGPVDPSPVPSTTASTPVTAATAEGVPVASAVQPGAADAVRATEVHLPTVGVRSALVELDVGQDGALEVPADPAVAGWFVGGAAPGEPGPTVIAGHVDSRSGPGVFLRLDELAVGDGVEVTRSDGRVVAHRVVTVERHPKTAFPTARVYGPTPAPELRLITCGGGFDPRSRHYRDNVIVTAVAVR